jgi:hypothetical protein
MRLALLTTYQPPPAIAPSRLLGLHRFSRSSRLAVWMAFGQSCGLSEAAAAAMARGEAPPCDVSGVACMNCC